MEYRAEIDGLRAIAVISVILYHAGIPGFAGGYTGVDVFFVISGYLITNIIADDLKNGRFSLVSFYNRRARRILPALLFVSILTFPAAWVWLPPADMYDYAQSLVSLAFFSSNFLFWLESGYFQAASELKPLIHTWSLAVEEQYYLLYPVLLSILWQLGTKRILLIFCAISLLSFGYADWASVHQPSAAFYLLPARAWELLLGGLASFNLRSQQDTRISPVLGDQMSFLGLMLIAYTVLLLDDSIGIALAIPSIGTVLIILYANHSKFAKRLLSQKHIVSLGLISYSAYLWHQPLLAFAKRIPSDNYSGANTLFVVFLTFLLSYLTWKFIEQPFRDKQKISNRNMVGALAFSVLTVVCLGLYGTSDKGLEQRYAEVEQLIASYYDPAIDSTEDESDCFFRDEISNDQLELCLESIGDNFAVLLGDSHAASLSNSLRNELRSTEIGLISFSSNGCPPASVISDYISTVKPSCKSFISNVYDLINTLEADTIIVSSIWTFYLKDIYDTESRNLLGPKTSSDIFNPALNAGTSGYVDAVSKIADEIGELGSKKKLVLVGPIPQNDGSWSSIIRSSLMKNKRDFRLYSDYTEHKKLKSLFDELVRFLPSETEIVLPENLICNTEVEEQCEIIRDGKSLYRDTNHPTDTYAKLIAEQIVAQLYATGNQ